VAIVKASLYVRNRLEFFSFARNVDADGFFFIGREETGGACQNATWLSISRRFKAS
jgi:hypothetical protein